ncbi:MAG TPA: hypothetical protein PLZ84_08695, partial [Clostridia bacterium]|nr:hypothetical protein [Clostridia bacterium]
DKVLHGDESLEGKVIHTAQPGGTYRNITYVFPAGTKFNLNEEDILLLNSYSNLTGMPYSKLIKLDDGRYLSYDQKAYTVDELASMIDEAFD